MEAVVAIVVLAVIGLFAYNLFVKTKNVAGNVASVARRVSTRVNDSVQCKSCGTELPTNVQLECSKCGFTKTRNIASACPNCGFTAQFAPCPKCGESVRFA